MPGVTWQGQVHEFLFFPPEVRCGRRIQDTDIQYAHYGYVKPQYDVFRRWKLYSELEGKPNHYEQEFGQTGITPNTILNDRTGMMFMAEHPEVIKDYCNGVINGTIERPNY